MPLAASGGDVAEGVDEDRAVLSAQAKGGLAVPINAHDAPLLPCPLPSGCVRDADARTRDSLRGANPRER